MQDGLCRPLPDSRRQTDECSCHRLSVRLAEETISISARYSFQYFKAKEAACRMKCDYNFAGLYDLRLKLSQKADLVHINEYLYSEVENDTRKSGEKIF